MITVEYLLRTLYMDADQQSRSILNSSERKLNLIIFANIRKVFSTPNMGFLASRVLHQVPPYIAWKPDPLQQRDRWLPTVMEESGITQKMKFSFKDFFSKCDQIRSFLWICSHLLKKYVKENFILWSVWRFTDFLHFFLLVGFYNSFE